MARNPKNWNEYEQGGTSPRGSIGSFGNVTFDESAERDYLLHTGRQDEGEENTLRRRRLVIVISDEKD